MNMKRNILKLSILMIVVLLSCLKSYAQTIPSTGEQNKDSIEVIIPISYIKLANQKLLERKYLIEINAQKDSIINDYKNYIEVYEEINKEYQAKIDEYNNVNKNLSNSLQKQKKTSLVLGTVAGASVLTIVLLSIAN